MDERPAVRNPSVEREGAETDESGAVIDTTREPVERAATEAAEENRDTTTRREAFELELMEEDRSDAGREVEVDTIDVDDSKEPPTRTGPPDRRPRRSGSERPSGA